MKKGKNIYNLIIDHLKYHNKYDEIDHYLIDQLQTAYDIYNDAREHVDKDGPVQKAKSGWGQKSGYYTVLQDAEKTIIALQSKLGIYKMFGDKLNYIEKKSTKGSKNPLDEI